MIENTVRRLACGGVLALVAVFLPMLILDCQAQEGRQVISHPAPIYSDFARKLGLVGVVKVQVVIASDGKIKATKVIGGHPVLVDAVQQTLKNWRYEAAAGETTAVLEFRFNH